MVVPESLAFQGRAGQNIFINALTADGNSPNPSIMAASVSTRIKPDIDARAEEDIMWIQNGDGIVLSFITYAFIRCL